MLVEDRVDYPEGTVLELDIREPVDELSENELVELDAALDAAVGFVNDSPLDAILAEPHQRDHAPGREPRGRPLSLR